ncbi:PTS lactose/cellobiose transporter subunit IIA [Aerococcaceae bacterium zg-B36]|uniref:PTS lactose/cellobiose transporter subunit IIA n=1 Tax=Aerococcaceae bacterium zg-252 TaxID=2796928 RepID=UPI001BD8958C|nr:PTS lactose/cellobiose transporter subunit IIA [Aerococcaceae bacterium zg-B36]
MSVDIEQQLMRLIVLSGKAMGQGLNTIMSDYNNQQAWDEVKKYVNQAHDVQTALIEREVRGENIEVSLLAVHAQDHFMNSHFLTQIGELLLEQQKHIHLLEERLVVLEEQLSVRKND